MKIAFYAPFKPLGHKSPSGDLAIAKGIVSFLEARGHKVEIQSDLRVRWIFFKPWLWPMLMYTFFKIVKNLKKNPPDVWLTYHTYYKAPDLLGPWVCSVLGIKYFIFQGIYSTIRKRRIKTILGFYLNRAALIRARHIFTNKRKDFENLSRLIPGSKLSYIVPGIHPVDFKRDDSKRDALRKHWGDETTPVILTAAMFRDDVKTQGLSWMIKTCKRLVDKGLTFRLIIAGSGKKEKELKTLAQKYIPGYFKFVGKISRKDMYSFYSSGDIFAFPGIRESLGMVFLEAQSCGLPVVAFDNGGIPEVVKNSKTGFLVPMYDRKAFINAIEKLMVKNGPGKQMCINAVNYIRNTHDIDQNYLDFEKILIQAVH